MGVYILFTMEQVAEQAQEFVNTQLNEMKNTVENWESLPWSPVTPPEVVAEKMPSFVCGELLFAIMSLICFIHAWKKGRTYLLVWFASIFAGCANDAVFMFLPGVDNFFHAQGTIMITPRLPLYILFVYNSFMYVSVVAGFQLQLGAFGNSCAVGLLAELFYCVYDLVGIKFIWWTWHDTDVATSERLFDVPIGSSMWVITFCSSFYFLLYTTSCRTPRIGRFQFVYILLVLCIFTTPLMMLQMGACQLFGQMGRPNIVSLMILLLFYLMIISFKMIFSGNWLSKRFPSVQADGFLSAAINIYFGALTGIAVYFKPETHTSTGVHQSLGECGVQELDLSGLPREKYLCSRSYDERFNIVGAPNTTSQWYTISGLPIENHDVWILAICLLSLVGIILYTYLYTARKILVRRPLAQRTPSVNPVAKKIGVTDIPKATDKQNTTRKRKNKKS